MALTQLQIDQEAQRLVSLQGLNPFELVAKSTVDPTLVPRWQQSGNLAFARRELLKQIFLNELLNVSTFNAVATASGSLPTGIAGDVFSQLGFELGTGETLEMIIANMFVSFWVFDGANWVSVPTNSMDAAVQTEIRLFEPVPRQVHWAIDAILIKDKFRGKSYRASLFKN